MPSNPWLKLRPTVKIGRIKKTLTIPAFSRDCGPVASSFISNADTSAGITSGDTSIYTDFTSALTIEAWIRFPGGLSTTKFAIFYRQYDSGDPDPQYELSVVGNKLRFIYRKGGVTTAVVSSREINQFDWTHVAITWDGTTIRFYFDGVQDPTTYALAASITARVSGDNFIGLANGNSLGDSPVGFIGNIDELRIWNVARTLDQLVNAKNSHRIVALETGLKLYCKFQEGSGNATREEVSGTDLGIGTYTSGQNPWDTEGFPHRFGASFVAAEFSVTFPASGSFIHPVAKPYDDVNFEPVVAWTDDSGIFQRRKLWTVEGVDRAPEVETYTGEVLPSSFTMEIWNVDGEVSVDLDEDLVLQTSFTTLPTTATDVTPVEITDPTIDTSIAENFPLTPFPLVFNDTQTYV